MAPRTKVVLESRQFSSSSSPDTPRTQVAYKVASSHLPAPQLLRVLKLYYKVHLSPAFRALDTHDLRRGLRAQPANRTLACISRTRRAGSPQRVARAAGASHLHFAHSTRTISAEGCARRRQIALSPAFRALAHSTRTISAEGCARSRQIALSPAFRALDAQDLRRGLRAQPAHRTCISRTRHARSPQRVARAAAKSHSRLHFARSTRTISAEGCASTGRLALSPAFRALDTHDLRRGLRGHRTNRALACISRTRHARSPQRVARAAGASHSRLHFAHSTRAISAEGCARAAPIALSPAFRALDTHDLRRGLHFRLTLFVPPSAFKREFIKW